jgi:hypothetical protein
MVGNIFLKIIIKGKKKKKKENENEKPNPAFYFSGFHNIPQCGCEWIIFFTMLKNIMS